jgi:hypothetical protein
MNPHQRSHAFNIVFSGSGSERLRIVAGRNCSSRLRWERDDPLVAGQIWDG